MTQREWILLNPGPANTSRRVREALLTPDLCHREPTRARATSGRTRSVCRALGTLVPGDMQGVVAAFRAALRELGVAAGGSAG